jgi:hypothetical protein
METICSSETLADFKGTAWNFIPEEADFKGTTWSIIPEDSTLQSEYV